MLVQPPPTVGRGPFVSLCIAPPVPAKATRMIVDWRGAGETEVGNVRDPVLALS